MAKTINVVSGNATPVAPAVAPAPAVNNVPADQLAAALALIAAAGLKVNRTLGRTPEQLAKYNQLKAAASAAVVEFKKYAAEIGLNRKGGPMSPAGLATIRSGLAQYQLAGRPTKAEILLVYGPNGYKMTWPQRNAVIPAQDFQAALAAAKAKSN
jgi:hypothetical protein